MRYIDVHIVSSQQFKCSLSHANFAKKDCISACNAIFGKICRFASEDVILTLSASQCLPILLYGLEAFALSKSELQSLLFTVNRFYVKLFKTSSIGNVTECQ